MKRYAKLLVVFAALLALVLPAAAMAEDITVLKAEVEALRDGAKKKQARNNALKKQILTLRKEILRLRRLCKKAGIEVDKPVAKDRVEKAPAEPSWQTNYYAMKEMLDAKLQDLKGENETSAQVKLRVDKFKEWAKATFIGKRVEWQGIVNDVRLGGRIGNRKVRVDFALLGIDGVAKDAFKNIDTTLRSDEIADVSRGAAARLCTIIAGIGVKAEKGKLVATIQTRKRLVEIDKVGAVKSKGAKSKSR